MKKTAPSERDAHFVRDAGFARDARLRRVGRTHRITYHILSLKNNEKYIAIMRESIV